MNSGDYGFLWPEVRSFAREFFAYWPDGEDLIWAKTVWPAIEENVAFGIGQDEVDGYTRSILHALSALYAESAVVLGLPKYKGAPHLERMWFTVNFGSHNNFDETLWRVGRALMVKFTKNDTEPDRLLIPLLRSLVTGADHYCHGAKLERYLKKVARSGFSMQEFREDELYRFWVGGHFNSNSLACLP